LEQFITQEKLTASTLVLIDEAQHKYHINKKELILKNNVNFVYEGNRWEYNNKHSIWNKMSSV
jgi:hypothetical protein